MRSGCYNGRMETPHVECILLIGPTGSGKSTVGAKVATLLHWAFVDSDEAIAQQAGRSIPEIFADEGEAGFREREGALLRAATAQTQVVVATGGGIGDRPDNLALLHARGWVVALGATPETTLTRMELAARADGIEIGDARPMLRGDAPIERIRALHQRRQAWYAEADETLDTNALSADMVAMRLVAGLIARGRLAGAGAVEQVRHVATAAGEGYDAIVAWGGLATLGQRLAALRLPPRLHIVSDATVASAYGAAVQATLARAGFDAALHVVPAGEASKSRAQLDGIHDWLAQRRAERSEALVALGGGVVGDLAGFAAATYLRGLPLVQVPTSLLAQVDASIGGKVAIDHPRGKNLIGAFYQPRLVLADPATLLTLPPRQRTEGWAEVIKHGVALDRDYFERLEQDAEALCALQPAPLTQAIATSVALKASVVEGDERERDGGRRHLLNYGHTVAHAIETITNYSTWLHGEAVAVGMEAEARLGQLCGLTPPDVVTRQHALLTRFGLPTDLDGSSASLLLGAALWDKKVSGGRVRWVLATALGSAALVADVADADVRAALVQTGAVDDVPPSTNASAHSVRR